MSEDLQLLNNVIDWPMRQGKMICCVKNRDMMAKSFTLDAFGMLIADPLTLQIHSLTGTGITIFREAHEPLQFDSIEALLAAGWVVD
jgi:hypothetical protein